MLFSSFLPRSDSDWRVNKSLEVESVLFDCDEVAVEIRISLAEVRTGNITYIVELDDQLLLTRLFEWWTLSVDPDSTKNPS